MRLVIASSAVVLIASAALFITAIHARAAQHRAQRETTASSTPCPETITDGQRTAGPPTAAQRRAAKTLVDETRSLAQPYRDFSRAEREGFRQTDTIHWYLPARITDHATLDPRRPEFLIYNNNHRLIGVMFMTEQQPGPQVGGPLTVWHTHCWAQQPCIYPGGIMLRSDLPACAGRTLTRIWMLHVWLVPNRMGPFGEKMTPVMADG